MHSTFVEDDSTNMEEHFIFMEENSKNHVRACVFCIFRIVWILIDIILVTARIEKKDKHR